MRLLSLTLESFRSYETLTMSFPEKETISVLLGENATGKTNVLEAIAVLATLSSPRRAEETDLIRWEGSYYRARGVCRSDGGEEKTLEVVSQVSPRKQRACFINGVRTPSQQYLGILPLVTFEPNDLLLFTGPPQLRRNFLNALLTQVSPVYATTLAEYERALKQRSALLHAIKEGLERPSSLSVWDEKLATAGAIITAERLQLFATLELSLRSELQSFGDRCLDARFSYLRKGQETEEAPLREELLGLLTHYRERDVLAQTTLIGPHRDDWVLLRDQRDIASSASRGEQRAAVLALLLLQASFLDLRRNEKPLLLLDDVFSEFDASHRSAVLGALARNQVIMTALQIDPHLTKKARIIACPLV